MQPTVEERGAAHVTKVEAWQSRAWELYDEIGEVRFASRYMGDAIARLDLYVGVRPSPQDDPVPLEAEGDSELGYTAAEAVAAEDALERLRSPLGGRREIQRSLGVHLFIPGECYLVGEPRPVDYPELEERWDVYSVDEFKQDDRGHIRLVTPGKSSSSGRELPADAVSYRIWRPHPRSHQWADSPIRSALGILEELSVLTRAIHSAAVSRLKGPGVLFLPNSMRNGMQGPEQDGQATAGDQLVRDFITAAGTAIKDSGSAFAQVPLVVWMDDERWKDMGSDKLLKWDQGVDDLMAKLREELITRFAAAIDLPPEILTGKGGLNHWSAWLISDEAFRNHIEPLAMLIMDALTVDYLRPALAQMGVQDPQRFELWYDPSPLVSDPDSGTRALDAFDRQLISADAARRELGYSEDDAPDEDDEEVEPEGPTEPEPDPEDQPAPSEDQQQPPDPADQPGQGDPEAAVEVVVPEVEPVTAGMVSDARTVRAARLTEQFGLADLALLRDLQMRGDGVMRRALEKANARLRSLASKDPVARARLDGIPSGELLEAEVLGSETIRRLTAAEDDEQATEALVAGSLAAIGPWYDERVTAESEAMLHELGLSAPEEAHAREQFAAGREVGKQVLIAGMLALAGSILHRRVQPDLGGESDGSLMPTGVTRDALRVAGGGGAAAATFYTGETVRTTMATAGFGSMGYEWVYGPQAWRARPYQPHLALDGMTFRDPEDERLGNSGMGWPGVTGFWPGDHKGCMCSVVQHWFAAEPTCAPLTAALSCPRDQHDALTQARGKVDQSAAESWLWNSNRLTGMQREGKALIGEMKSVHDGLTSMLMDLPTATTSYRFIPSSSFGARVGDTISDAAWATSTVDGDQLDMLLASIRHQIDDKGIVLLQIESQAGTRATYLGGIELDEDDFEGAVDFHELVFPPNTRMEVLSFDDVGRPGPGGTTVHDARVKVVFDG